MRNELITAPIIEPTIVLLNVDLLFRADLAERGLDTVAALALIFAGEGT